MEKIKSSLPGCVQIGAHRSLSGRFTRVRRNVQDKHGTHRSYAPLSRAKSEWNQSAAAFSVACWNDRFAISLREFAGIERRVQFWYVKCSLPNRGTAMKRVILVGLTASVLSISAVPMQADTFTVLGTADSFAVLGASTVTNTGPTVLSGNLGLYPGTSITGFPPGTVVNGSTYINNGTAQTARADALTGYNTLAGMLPVTLDLTGQDLGSMTLGPGVYKFDSSAQLTGPLTLNFGGMNDQNIVFQIGSTLTTASASSVVVENQGTGDNVYWQVGSSATLGTTSAFQGDIIAYTSITLDHGANIGCGSALALNGAVTLDTNNVTVCSGGGSNVTPVSLSPVPEMGSLWLLGSGMLVLAGFLRRFAA